MRLDGQHKQHEQVSENDEVKYIKFEKKSQQKEAQ